LAYSRLDFQTSLRAGASPLPGRVIFLMVPLTPGVEIDELRRALRESEWRRQAAEIKLADRERQLGTAHQTIAAQDHRIVWLTAEVARLGGTAATNSRNDVWRPGPRAA
jgi:hypothetical protein